MFQRKGQHCQYFACAGWRGEGKRVDPLFGCIETGCQQIVAHSYDMLVCTGLTTPFLYVFMQIEQASLPCSAGAAGRLYRCPIAGALKWASVSKKFRIDLGRKQHANIGHCSGFFDKHMLPARTEEIDSGSSSPFSASQESAFSHDTSESLSRLFSLYYVGYQFFVSAPSL